VLVSVLRTEHASVDKHIEHIIAGIDQNPTFVVNCLKKSRNTKYTNTGQNDMGTTLYRLT